MASIWGFCSISYRKDGIESKMEVDFLLKNRKKREKADGIATQR